MSITFEDFKLNKQILNAISDAGYTLPTPPFIYLYPLFMFQCTIFAWAAWTRGSTGMIANYALIASIDLIAYVRMISNA
jgi:hypothetical protein